SQSNVVQGDCTSSGSCTAGQSATVNNTTTQAGWTAPSIPDVHIKCQPNQPCTATPPPVPTSVTGPTSPNPSDSATFSWSETATSGVSFLCSIDGGTPVSCQSGVPFFQGYGTHTFQVQATDNFGHGSAFAPATAISFTNI